MEFGMSRRIKPKGKYVRISMKEIWTVRRKIESWSHVVSFEFSRLKSSSEYICFIWTFEIILNDTLAPIYWCRFRGCCSVGGGLVTIGQDPVAQLKGEQGERPLEHIIKKWCFFNSKV